MKASNNIGYVFAILSAILFGISTPIAKHLLGQIEPWLLAGLLYLGAGLGLIIILVLRHQFTRRSSIFSLNRMDCKWLLGATISGGVIGPVLLMMGLVNLGAAATSLLLNLESVFTAIIAWIIFKEHTDLRLIFGVALIIAGSIILGWSPSSQVNSIIGISFISGACFAWAIDNNLTRKISACDPVQLVAIKSTVAGVTNTLLALAITRHLSSNLYIVSMSMLVGFIGYGISLILFILALRHIGTARTGAYFSIAPFVGACTAIIFLDEPLTWQLVLAGSLMGFGIWLHLTEHHEHEHEHEPITHTHSHAHDEHHQHGHTDVSFEEPHSHEHTHQPLRHIHPHYPDIHHRHKH